jgi:hypothetical protein
LGDNTYDENLLTRTSSYPPRAAPAHVGSSHGQLCSTAHLGTCRCRLRVRTSTHPTGSLASLYNAKKRSVSTALRIIPH